MTRGVDSTRLQAKCWGAAVAAALARLTDHWIADKFQLR